MKLNNKGWGLFVFLGFVLVFVAFLLIAGVNAYKLGLSEDDPTIQFGPNNNSNTENKNNKEEKVPGREKYEDLEEKIIESSANYRRAYYSNLLNGDSVYVTFKTLIDYNYLSNSGDCSGYVKIYHSSGDDYQYTVYFKCPDYVSGGYLEDLDN